MRADQGNLEQLLETRKQLIADIQSRLDEPTTRFLLNLHDGTPDFDTIDRARAAALPAVQWKLMNLARMRTENPKKHAEQRAVLAALLG